MSAVKSSNEKLSSMTIPVQIPGVNGASYGSAIAYIIQTTAGAINPTWTITVAGNLQGEVVSFFSAAAGVSIKGLLLMGVGI